jgi:hypothetical protein
VLHILVDEVVVNNETDRLWSEALFALTCFCMQQCSLTNLGKHRFIYTIHIASSKKTIFGNAPPPQKKKKNYNTNLQKDLTELDWRGGGGVKPITRTYHAKKSIWQHLVISLVRYTWIRNVSRVCSKIPTKYFSSSV